MQTLNVPEDAAEPTPSPLHQQPGENKSNACSARGGASRGEGEWRTEAGALMTVIGNTLTTEALR